MMAFFIYYLVGLLIGVLGLCALLFAIKKINETMPILDLLVIIGCILVWPILLPVLGVAALIILCWFIWEEHLT